MTPFISLKALPLGKRVSLEVMPTAAHHTIACAMQNQHSSVHAPQYVWFLSFGVGGFVDCCARLSHIQVGELLSGSTTVLVTIKPGTVMNTGKLEALFSLRCSASLAELMNSNKEIPV